MANKQEDMMNLLTQISEDELYFSPLNYFNHSINELRKYDLAEILAYQAKFPSLYVINIAAILELIEDAIQNLSLCRVRWFHLLFGRQYLRQ